MDAAMRRSDIRCLTIRPSWVQWEGNYDRNLGPFLRDPEGSPPSAGLWAYIDVYDLADALRLAAESDLDTHEVFYIASPDNNANRPLADLIRHHHGDAIEIREPLPRPDASGLSIAKAQRLLGYAPTRSWRDYLSEDGTLLDAAARAARARRHRHPARARGRPRRSPPRSSAGPRPAGARWGRRARPRRPRPGRASRARAARRPATRASRGAR